MNPFAESKERSVGGIGERALIENIAQWLGSANPSEPFGIGDDCAVFFARSPGAAQLVTSDPILYGLHFDESLSPQRCAAKLAKRNLSDLAAMGGRPRVAVVSLALAPAVSIQWLQAFYEGLAESALRYDFQVVGGDISSGPPNFLGAFLTMLGEMAPDSQPLPRHQATPGCHLYVTGELGGTLLGKHHAFEPRLEEGEWLAIRPECVSCSDLSDGLGKDYANILAPSALAAIDCATLPLGADADRASRSSGKDPLYHAFNDGEDFELLFAIAADADLPSFESAWRQRFETPLARIGQVFSQNSPDSPRLRLTGAPEGLSPSGYEHLR